jgi:hypothetical protein
LEATFTSGNCSTSKNDMLKYCLVLAFSIVSFLSCSKENKEKEIPEAIKDLMEEANKNCICDPYIDQYLWKEKIIYFLGYKGPVCDWIPTFYNEKSEQIIMEANYNLNQFFADSRLIKNIWTCGK